MLTGKGKSGFRKLLVCMLILGVCTGCGRKETGKGESLSESAVSSNVTGQDSVSGGVVGGSEVSGRDVGISHIGQSYYENDDNWYDWQSAIVEEYAVLIQYRLDKKTKVQEIAMEMEMDQVAWVTNEWLYYTTWDEEENDTLWRVPIRKTKDGDSILTKKKEKLLQAPGFWVSYATDSYLIVGLYVDDYEIDTEIYKFDLKTKKKKALMKGEGGPHDLELVEHYMDDQKISWKQNYSFMIEGELIMESEDKLYRLNPETEKVTVMFTKPEEAGDITYAFYQGEFYFECDNALYQYNRDTRKPECVISKKKMVEAVGKLKSAKIEGLRLIEMVLYKGKMYLPFKVQWKEKNPKNGQETIYEREELFYVKMGRFDKVFREDKLMDYQDEDGIFGKCETEKGDTYFGYSYEYEDFKDGKVIYAYMEYSEEEESFDLHGGGYVSFDVATKKGEELEAGWYPPPTNF